MADLLDQQWELDGLVFGENCPIDIEAEVDPGESGWITQDAQSPVANATMFGRDRIEPGTWSFKLFTNVDDEVQALAERARAVKAWRATKVRDTPGEVLALRYRIAGRTRRVYGRPRRFAAPMTNLMYSGVIPITCDFKLASDLYFDDVEMALPVRATAPPSGGFLVPFLAPLILQRELGPRDHTFFVRGDEPTPGVFDFHGPSTAAFLELDGQRVVQLTGTIPPGVTVTVDARPWVMSVYRSDGAGVAGMLDRRTRLPRLLFSPGEHHVTYGGYDETGASSATVRWRVAHPSV